MRELEQKNDGYSIDEYVKADVLLIFVGFQRLNVIIFRIYGSFWALI